MTRSEARLPQEISMECLKWPEDVKNHHRWQNFLVSFNDKLFYSYMNRVLRKGAILHRQRETKNEFTNNGNTVKHMVEELSRDDLYTSPEYMASDHLRSEFKRLREEEKRNAKNSPRVAFLRVLWGLVKPTFIPAGLFQLIYILTQCAVPLVVKVLLTKLEEHPGENFTKTGLPIAFVLFLLSILEGISSERQKFLSFQSGIICKTAIINSAYDHILSLTPAGKAGLTSGETTNLVAIDAQKLFELTQDGHQIWSCPLAMIIVTVLLLLELGPSILVGMASMFLMVPLVQRIVLYMMAIRKKRVAQSDRRVEATSSMLQGIKFTKLNHYEDKFLRRVTEAREAEMKLLGKELAVFGVTMFLTVTSPVIGVALTLGTYVLLDDGNVLTASTTFTTLFLFAALRFPINYAGKLMGKAAQGLSACQRFADFFERETNPDSTSQRKIDDDNIHNDDTVLKVVDGNFFVGSGEMSEDTNPDISNRSKALFTLSDINISVKRSEVLCVVGPVGCGKSTLCQGLIGDVPSKSTGIAIKGKVAYASQTPFILNSTFRENILFGNEYDKTKYDKVLEACCLMPDLDQIGPARDLTEIGERGVTLSGGQKQRVSLARAAYCQPDVAIFDDPLSALDAATGKAVFEKLIKSENSVLSRSAIVLVTHASHFLNRVDKILVLVDGRPEFLGNWDSLLTFQPSNSVTLEAISSIRSAVQEDHSEDEVLPSNESSTNVQKLSDRGGDAVGDLMTTEEREFGLTDWRTWFKWFKYAGGIHFVAVAVLTLGLDRFFYVATEWWIASWTAAQTEPINRLGREYPPQSEGRKAQYEYLATFGIILLISFVFTMSRTQWLIQAGGRCSNKLFTLMTKRVMRAPMWYFETTPLGRILNRFTHDMEELDITLTQTMTTVMTSVGWFVTGFALQTAILPWQSLALSFIMVIYWLLLLHYRKSAIDLQRLDAVSRSPIQAQLAEVLDGAPIIRVHDQVDYFARIFRSALDNNSSAMMNFLAANRWLSVRIQMVGSFAVLASVAAVVTFNEVLMLPTGIAALLIIWSSKFTISLGFMVQAISESEAALTSVERVDDMTRVPQEKDAITDSSSVTLASDWPSSGSLVFNDVSLRYRPGLPLSLDGLSFSLQTGQRCGIVGRTGAGKSTLSVALFRLVEIENGTITLDGVDLSKLGLADVRGRKNGMCIIPQDPVLFSGSLRECLDPFNDSTDDEVLDALRAIRLVNVSERGIDVLKDRVEEGGSNYSVGERQLLCLARAILAKPRLLVLDEATASVDGETDAFIQRMLRTRFQGATLLTIAHRLNTIMDYDVILAIENGKAAEFGSPQELLERRGLFSSLVDSTGKQSSAALRRISLASDE